MTMTPDMTHWRVTFVGRHMVVLGAVVVAGSVSGGVAPLLSWGSCLLLHKVLAF